ncbi:hypothetical protein F2S72_01495 [Pseudomonas syringae pv. actinidiae]|nr:hypothetical protein [Pseudomonas syringae pv. actinidiae]
MTKLEYLISASLLMAIAAPAQAGSETLVTLTTLDKTSTVVGLQDAGSKCRYYGGLAQKNVGDFEVVLERKVCPDLTGVVVDEAIKGKAWIGEFPELPHCAGKADCPRALPAGASITAEL